MGRLMREGLAGNQIPQQAQPEGGVERKHQRSETSALQGGQACGGKADATADPFQCPRQ